MKIEPYFFHVTVYHGYSSLFANTTISSVLKAAECFILGQNMTYFTYPLEIPFTVELMFQQYLIAGVITAHHTLSLYLL